METSTELLAMLQARDVGEALQRLDSGEPTLFADSTKFDLVWRGKRFPPKRVAGLALQIMTGQQFRPKSFKGGSESSCFRALRRCGFTIISKHQAIEHSLTEDISELLSLQTRYQSTNTEEMQRRGFLIRDALPEHIRHNIGRLEPIFSDAGFSFSVEGSDGIGRKVESPWVRIFDEIVSPSATTGWYVVLHFSRDGSEMFATLGCGATTLRQGSLVPIAVAELQRWIHWAKNIAQSEDFPVSLFQESVDLKGNKLSLQFERATAFAKSYRMENFDEDVFWADIKLLCQLLVKLYERERLGQSPLPDQPEVQTGLEAIAAAITKRRGISKGQGRNLSVAERIAIENQAMAVAHEKLLAEGFADIRDVHKDHSYDFEADRSGSRWMIEVKGTTSTTFEAFLLTATELTLHQANSGQTVLVLVSEIEILRNEGETQAVGGRAEIHSPWIVDEWVFEPTAFRAKRQANLR